MTSWSDAAARYRAQRPEVKLTQEDQRINNAIRELGTFLGSPEGASGIELLAASDQYIRLGSSEFSGHGIAFVINGKGMQKVQGPSGMHLAYAKEGTAPTFTTANIVDFVVGLSRCDSPDATLEEIVPYLRESLDRIASSAP